MPSCFPVVSSCDVASGKLPISLSLLEVYERQVPVYILVITILAYAFSVASSKWFPAPCRFCHVTLIIIQASFSIRFLKFRQKLCLQSISSTTSSYRASAMPPPTPCFGFSLPLLITCMYLLLPLLSAQLFLGYENLHTLFCLHCLGLVWFAFSLVSVDHHVKHRFKCTTEFSCRVFWICWLGFVCRFLNMSMDRTRNCFCSTALQSSFMWGSSAGMVK